MTNIQRKGNFSHTLNDNGATMRYTTEPFAITGRCTLESVMALAKKVGNEQDPAQLRRFKVSVGVISDLSDASYRISVEGAAKGLLTYGDVVGNKISHDILTEGSELLKTIGARIEQGIVSLQAQRP